MQPSFSGVYLIPSTDQVHFAVVQCTCKPLDSTQLSCPQLWVCDREQELGAAHKYITKSLRAHSCLLLPVNPLCCTLACLRCCKCGVNTIRDSRVHLALGRRSRDQSLPVLCVWGCIDLGLGACMARGTSKSICSLLSRLCCAVPCARIAKTLLSFEDYLKAMAACTHQI